jgi:hypothetical protein
MNIGLRDDLIKRASCEKGVAIREIDGWTPIQMHEAFGSLREQGRVVHVGNRHHRRFFADPEAAKRYEAELAQIKAAKKAAVDAKLAKLKRDKRAAESAIRPPKPRGRPPKVKLVLVVEADPKLVKVKAEKPPKAPKPPKAIKCDPKPKFGKVTIGVNVPRYTGQKWDKGSPASNPNGVKPQKLPGHPGYDMRYSLPPGAVVEGEFSRLPLGATLEAA